VRKILPEGTRERTVYAPVSWGTVASAVAGEAADGFAEVDYALT
jgi:hypothetical protein